MGQHLVFLIPRQLEERLVDEDDRMARRLGVGEHHRHPCRLGGDDERAEFFLDPLDVGLGGFLLPGLLHIIGHGHSLLQSFRASRCTRNGTFDIQVCILAIQV